MEQALYPVVAQDAWSCIAYQAWSCSTGLVLQHSFHLKLCLASCIAYQAWSCMQSCGLASCIAYRHPLGPPMAYPLDAPCPQAFLARGGLQRSAARPR